LSGFGRFNRLRKWRARLLAAVDGAHLVDERSP